MGGVIRKIPLGEIVEFGRGQIIKNMTKLIQNQQLPSGPYPIISSATTALAMYDQFNTNANQVVVSSHGINSGFVSYQKQPFWATPLCHILNAKDPQVLNNKFLYYALIAQQNKLKDLKAGGAIPFISQSDLKTIEIDLPDLAIQKQIVHYLDHLDQLCNNLNQGLPKAIINANQQYRYYLNLLTTFNLS